MSKKKDKSKRPSGFGARCMNIVLDNVAHAIVTEDWAKLDGADALADEELEALGTGAIAAITMVRAMFGAFGAENRNSTWQAGSAKIAEGIRHSGQKA